MEPAFTMRDEIADMLSSLADEGTEIDTGRTGNEGTIWITVDGEQFCINVEHQVVK